MHALRRKPIGALTVEDLRLLIGQNIGLAHLLPLAMEVLRADPMTAGDFYEGDPLSAVMNNRTPWGEMPTMARELRSIVSTLTDLDSWLRERADTFLDLLSRTCDASKRRQVRALSKKAPI